MATRQALRGPSVWQGREIANAAAWVRTLTPAHLVEIDTALAQVQRRGLAWHQITPAEFPIPGLRPILDAIAQDLETGLGLVKLRGLPVERYAETELRQVYFGLGVHLGWPVFQNSRGELMRAIRDEGGDLGGRYGQIEAQGQGETFLSSYARTLSNGRLRFHTDRTDAVSLLCVRQARSGGTSKICSSPAVHNAMLARRPDLLEVLFEDVPRSRLGEESSEASDVYNLPIFGLNGGGFTSHFSLTYIEAAQMVPSVRRLSTRQREAIALLLELAEELSFEMTLEPGDIQFLNSHVTYHGRAPFQDHAASGQDRLLLRIWYSMPNSRALPPGHEVLWRDIEAGVKRGGIGQIPSG